MSDKNAPTDPDAIWEAVRAVANERPAMRALFQELSLASFSKGVATIEVMDSSYGNVVRGRQEQITEIFQRIVGGQVRVDIGLADDEAPAVTQGAIDDAITNDPIIQQAKDLFGGTIVHVEVEAPAPNAESQ